MEPITFDTVIIGGGPAGFSAAIYASRASLSTCVFELGMPGGQIATSDAIENYPGIPTMSGAELGMKLQEHAESAGATIRYEGVTEVQPLEDGLFAIATDAGEYQARSVIVATGATPRAAGFAGEDAFRGRGVSYCATCDGMFYRNKRAFVVGGGNSACEEGLYLSNIAAQVEMVVRRDTFRAPRGVVDRLLARDNVSVRYQTSIASAEGDRLLQGITFRNTTTGVEKHESFDEGSVGIFVFAGLDPVTDLVKPYVELGPDGGVLTDEHMATRTSGLYCIGDMRSKALRQVVTAASDGAIAATAAYHYVEGRFGL